MQIYSPIAQDSLVVSGSMNVSGSVTAQSFTGSFSGTASYATNALTSSYALTASVALNVPATASYAVTALTASYANFAVNTTSASFAVSAAFASQASIASSASYATNAGTAGSASFATNASTAASASHAVSASYATASAFANNSTSASYALSASYAVASSTAISSSFATVAANASSASYALNSSNAVSASFASSASYAMSASYATASSFATTASYALFAATATTASFATNASTAASASFATNAGTAGSASYAVSASYATASSFASSASYALNASNAVTASHALNSVSASYALFAANSTSASYALSASYAFNSSVAISASYATNAGFAGSSSYAQQANTASSADNFTVRGTLTATNIVVQTITSSQSTITGSTKFGSIITNTHQFTGSVLVTGSITVIDGVTNNLTSSWANRAISSSFAANASTAASASFATSAANATTASHALQAVTASFALNSQNAFVQGGNSFGAQALLGTNDLQNLAFETNGTVRMIISGSSGQVGIGTNTLAAQVTASVLNVKANIADGNQLYLIQENDDRGWRFKAKNSGHLFIQSSYVGISTDLFTILYDTGNVGIGSVSPAYKLDVNGAGRFTTGVLIDGGSTFTAGELGFTNSASGAQFGIYTTGTSSPGMFFDHRATSNTGLWTWRNGTGGANTRMVLNGDGNLGIGTTTPSVKLQVVGDGLFNSNTNTNLTVNSNGGAAALTLTNTAGSQVIYGGIGGINAMDFYTNSSFRVRIDASGNVGIGTASPLEELHVFNSTTAAAVLVRGTDANVASSYMLQHGGGGSRTQFDGTWNIGYGSAETDFGLTPNLGGGLVFWFTSGSTTTNPMVLKRGGNALFGGSVGIGTTAPAYKLDVNGGAADTTIAAQTTGQNPVRLRLKNEERDFILTNNPVDNLLSFNYDGTNRFQFDTTNQWFNSGNVGIGTTNPTQKLHVIGSAAIATGDLLLTQGYGITWNSGDNYIKGISGYHLQFTTYDGAASQVEVMRLTGGSSGGARVGIGTTVPIGKLQVGGTSGNLLTIGTLTNDWGGDVAIGVTNGNGIIISKVNTTNDQNRVLVLSRDDAGGGGTVFGYKPSGLSNAIGFRLQSTGSSYFDGGNVGIGTTSPTSKLHVNGGDILILDAPGFGGKIKGYDDHHSIHFRENNKNAINYYEYGGNLAGGEKGHRFLTGGVSSSQALRFNVCDDASYFSTPLLIQTGVTSSEATLLLGAKDINEGGHMIFQKGTNYQSASHFDNFQNKLRIMKGTDASSQTVQFILQHEDGNIGIGSNSPVYKLDVAGTGRYTGNLRTDGVLNWNGSVGALSYGAGIVTMETNDATSIYLKTNGSTAVAIDTSQRVGIGTTVPSYKLDVWTAQSIRVVGSSTGYTQGSIIFQSSTTDTPSARGLGVYTFNEGTDATWFYGNGYNYGDAFVINRKAGSSYQDSAAAPGESSNWFLINNVGNVGIGESSPSYKLDVSGIIRSKSGTTGTLYLGETSGGTTYIAAALIGTPSTTYNPVGRLSIKLPTHGVGSDYGLTEQMSIQVPNPDSKAATMVLLPNGGNILVNTSSFSSPSLFNIKAAGSDGNQIYICQSNDDRGWRFKAKTDGHFYLQSSYISATSDAFMIQYDTGNVGIGTTSPLNRFHVQGSPDSLGRLLRLTSTAPSCSLNFSHTANGGLVGYANVGSTGNVFYATTGAGTIGSGIAMDNSSNFGINVTSMLARLHVSSDASSGTAPTVYLTHNAGFGQISALDPFHSLILRGIPSGSTGYGVTAGDQMSFVEYGGDFRFYRKDGSPPVLQGRLNGGTFTVTGDVVAYGSPSDVSLKTNIQPLEGALDKVTKLQGVSFTWKEDTETNQMTGITDDIGFIAQEVQEVLPELVRKNDNGLLSLRDKGITALLVEAIKELKAEIDELKNNKQ